MHPNKGLTIYLLSIRGTLASPSLEAARAIHNATAGTPANVAAAQALGDLSHMVYVPLGQPGGAREFLILDQWHSLEGLNQFFANPHVQEEAGQIFSQRDPVVWAPADGFSSYHLPAPLERHERFVGVVRGCIASLDAAQAGHNAAVGQSIGLARRRGNLSHEAYLRLAAPGSPEASEFLAVDVWMDAAGMREHYEDPAFMPRLQELFTAPPDAGIWVHPAGDWVEW